MQYCDDPNCKDCDGPPGSDRRLAREIAHDAVAENQSRAAAKLPMLPKDGTPVGQLRNKPCPCGSGKKFKKCCIRRVQAKASEINDMFPRVVVNPKTQENARVR